MATVSQNISTILSNAQTAASEMVSTVLGGLDFIYSQETLANELGPLPVVSSLPAETFADPQGLYDMLEVARLGLQDVGQDIPTLAALTGASTSPALEIYLDYVEGYKNEIAARLSRLPATDSRVFPISGFVKSETEKAVTALSPALMVPAFARAAFPMQVGFHLAEEATAAYWRAQIVEQTLQTDTDQTMNKLAVKRQLLEVMSLLEFAEAALQAAYVIMRKTILSPEDVLQLFRKLSAARGAVASGISENRAAVAGTQMEYINALLGYYDLFSSVEKLRMEASVLEFRLEAEAESLKITELVGAAAAAANTAAAGYSAARVGIVLSDKAFS